MFKSIGKAFLVYIAVLIIVLILPGDEGYNSILWKLILGQTYAVPIALVSLAVFHIIESGKKRIKELHNEAVKLRDEMLEEEK